MLSTDEQFAIRSDMKMPIKVKKKKKKLQRKSDRKSRKHHTYKYGVFLLGGKKCQNTWRGHDLKECESSLNEQNARQAAGRRDCRCEQQ